MAVSISEAEYVSLSEALKEVKGLSGLLSAMPIGDVRPVSLYEDSEGSIKWASSDMRSKHVD